MLLKEFFYFNKSDRKVLLFLLILGIGAATLFLGISEFGQTNVEVIPQDSTHLQSKSNQSFARSNPNMGYYSVESSQQKLFSFDPNTADSTELLRLGLRSWQVKNIYRYRAAGGYYRKPSDFARLYGLTVQQYRALEPYIQIKGDYRQASELFKDVQETPTNVRDTVRFPIKIDKDQRVALNTADTTTLKKVPGIGSYFARQIVNYRNKLGGYYRIQQLMEIEDFPEESLTYFTLTPSEIEKIQHININQLTLNQLKRHPYINYYMARAITDYRRLKGPIQRLDDLNILKDFTPSVIERLKPYIVYQ